MTERKIHRLILRAGRRLGLLRFHHGLGIAMMFMAWGVLNRPIGTVIRIETVAGLRNDMLALMLAFASIVYLLNHPRTLISFFSLIPLVFYTLFSFWYAVDNPDTTPWQPAISYLLITITAIAIFISHHLGWLMVLLATQWELTNDPSEL
jgi:carbon starvation protein CstA